MKAQVPSEQIPCQPTFPRTMTYCRSSRPWTIAHKKCQEMAGILLNGTIEEDIVVKQVTNRSNV